jgi:hypothetical protein
MWRDLERQACVSQDDEPEPTNAESETQARAGIIRRKPERRPRLVFRSSYLI